MVRTVRLSSLLQRKNEPTSEAKMDAFLSEVAAVIVEADNSKQAFSRVAGVFARYAESLPDPFRPRARCALRCLLILAVHRVDHLLFEIQESVRRVSVFQPLASCRY